MSTFSNNMKAFSKMPQNMGLEEVNKNPFDLAEPNRKSMNPNGNISHDLSQNLSD